VSPGSRGAGGAGDAISISLSGGPQAAATARRALGSLRGDLDPGVMETMRLLVTELVANSVRHAGARSVDLKIIVTSPSVWLEVTDPGPGFDVGEATTRAAQAQDSGWGLFLVDRLADRWGVSRDGNGTRVWFELRRVA
jgi:anti-sigma regulatory factor (Ser/Thr protein kinase)